MEEASNVRVLRGIPRWLLRGYLEDLGGIVVHDAEDLSKPLTLAASGWTACLTQLEDYRIGSLRSGQVELAVTGDRESVGALMVALEPRLFRGGG
jgi:hypothetical protein